jgi:hypothetical protein
MKVGTVQPPLGLLRLEWFVDQAMLQYMPRRHNPASDPVGEQLCRQIFRCTEPLRPASGGLRVSTEIRYHARYNPPLLSKGQVCIAGKDHITNNKSTWNIQPRIGSGSGKPQARLTPVLLHRKC